MSASDWRKVLKQLKSKPHVAEKYQKFNKPKDRKFGVASKKCELCGRFGAHISSFNINMCRHCFREVAEKIGFKKYN